MKRWIVRSLAGLAALLVLLASGLSLAGAVYEPNIDIPSGFEGKHVFVEGTPLRVLQKGSGRDVLLIHGSPGSIEDWSPIVDELARDFRVTAFDRPGQGFSGDTGRYGYEDNAAMALALIDALKLSDVVVAGHSYGGTTALAMAARAPTSVRAYVVIDSATYEPLREVQPAFRLLARPSLGRGFARAYGARIATRIEQGVGAEFHEGPPAGFTAKRKQIWTSPKVVHAFANEALGAAQGILQLSPKYRSIHAPVFIVSQADSTPRRANAERLHRDIKGSSLELVPASGHYVQFDKPSVILGVIRNAAAEP